MARALFDEARGQAKAGDWKGAASLLEEARAHDGADSDIRYLSALAARENGADVDEALGQLDAAFASGNFSDCDEAEARILAAGLLINERRWSEALAVLPKAAPGSSLEPRRRLARAEAFLGLGAETMYASELGEAMRRYPDDPSFPRLLFTRLSPSRPSEAQRPLVELALSRIARYAASDPELPVLAAPFMPDRGPASDAILAYRAMGGRSAAATLLALDYGMIDEAKAASELLSGAFETRLGDLRRALELARSDAGREAVASALAAYSGKIYSDYDGDGVDEATMEVAKGLALSFSLDGDQNGAAELEVSFADGLPASAAAREKGASLSLAYAAYPVLARATVEEDGSTSAFDLEAGALSYSPVSMSPIAGSGRSAIYLPEPTGESAPTERAIVASALRRSAETKEGVETLFLDKGVPERREFRVGGRLVSVLSYRLGRPESEKADMDGDGRFETLRRYDSAGKPASAAVDADGDGIFEYREEASFPFRKEWDLDANGSIDAVQYELPGGAIRCEYSSRLDGRFDEALTLKGGEIVALEKGGRPVSLVPDLNPKVFWIGSKPFDLGESIPSGDGLFVDRGRRYRLVRAGSRAFAEVIP
jgi:tetratricopeptide (TPR) repeat protein